MFLLISIIASSMLRGADAAFYYPNVQASLLEHILVDNWGAYASNFSSAITPCTNYVTQQGAPALNSGRTTAAQWMRVLFHDFITANISAGTGGIDASIGFETARGENSGSAFNDSFTFWRPFVNDAVSSKPDVLFIMVQQMTNNLIVADVVALGSAMSNNLCGGHNLPYRAGRVDATAADSTTGVPAPETDLEDTLVFFERAGFDKVDAIGLTACGHTMGSVHHVRSCARSSFHDVDVLRVAFQMSLMRLLSCQTIQTAEAISIPPAVSSIPTSWANTSTGLGRKVVLWSLQTMSLHAQI
jgi:hypothetical protein